MASSRLCSIPGCGKRACNIRGWCNAHYIRWRRHGTPEGVRTLNGEPLAFFERALAYSGDECLLWPFSKTPGGYGQLWLEGKRVVASRAICEAVNGPRPDGFEAAHACGNGSLGCVTPAHLSWKTRKDNQFDRVGHGTSNRGERCGAARLARDDVRKIRCLSTTLRQKEIAERYGISRAYVSEILSRKKWGWLD